MGLAPQKQGILTVLFMGAVLAFLFVAAVAGVVAEIVDIVSHL